jgi:hypothetical protein
MINAPITNTAVSGMPLAQAGVAAAVASTSRQVGSALGVAVLGSLVTAHITEGSGATSLQAGFAEAARPAWVVVIGCGLAVLALGLAATTEWARETSRRTAERFAVAAPAPAPATR